MRKQQNEMEFDIALVMPDASGQLCHRCGTPGAASFYNGQLFHMTCKFEAKLDAGELVSITAPTQRKRKKTGAARFKRTFGQARG